MLPISTKDGYESELERNFSGAMVHRYMLLSKTLLNSPS
jgi:hypothetical protein